MYKIICVITLFISILETSIIKGLSDRAICDSKRCIYGTCSNKTFFIHNTKSTHIKSTCVCFRGWTGDNCDMCSGRSILTKTEGSISDGRGNYSLNTACSWLLISPFHQTIRIRLLSLSTECGWDHLYIHDGDSVLSPLVAVFSGATMTNLPIELVLRSGYGFIHFYSDVAYNMNGFEMIYRMGNDTCPFDCNSRGKCISSGRCMCSSNWTGESCDIQRSEVTACPSQCSFRGHCDSNTGECRCYPGFKGYDCSLNTSFALWSRFNEHDNVDIRPPKLTSHASLVYDNFLWLFGGYNFREDTQFWFYKINLTSKTTYKLNSVPESLTARYGHSAVLYKDKFYIFGGKLIAGNNTNELWCFDTTSEQWSNIVVQGHSPFAVTGHTADVVGDSMYVIFGHSKSFGYSSFVQKFDLEVGRYRWSILQPGGAVVQGGFQHSSTVHAGGIYVHGGYHSVSEKSCFLSDRLIRYRPDTNSWYILRSSGEFKYLHTAVSLNGLMFVFGGNTHNQTMGHKAPSKCHSASFLTYDFECNQWTKLRYVAAPSVLPVLARFGHVTSVTDHSSYSHQLIVHGGFDGEVKSSTMTLTLTQCRHMTPANCINSSASRGLKCVYVNSQCMEYKANLYTFQCSQKGKLTQFQRNSYCSSLKYCNSCLHSSYGCSFCNGKCTGDANSCSNITTCKSIYTSSCDNNYNCETCHYFSNKCKWDSFNCNDKSAILPSLLTTLSGMYNRCIPACSSYSDCSSCTDSQSNGVSSANRCMWCQSMSQCIDQNAYLAEFVYGECRQWVTSRSMCQAMTCESKETCKDCQKLAECGWCSSRHNNGLGTCMKGTLNSFENCTSSHWYYMNCPDCQCNGHSNCSLAAPSKCTSCAANYSGSNCEYCKDGFFGDAHNGGDCTECNCGKRADYCNKLDGKCYCNTRGVAGAKCDVCKHDYFGNIHKGGTCYYKLITDFQFTFNLSAQEDLHITHLNFANFPTKKDRDIDFTVNCSGHATINITVITRSRPFELLVKNFNCQFINTKFSHKLYDFSKKENTTFFVYVYNFKTPFTIMISFSQFPEIDLIHFFITFFSCFLSLLILALVFWKLKQKYDTYRLRQRRKVVQKQRASRPTAFFDLDLGEPCIDNKNPQRRVSYIACEPLYRGRLAVVSVMVSLPGDCRKRDPVGQFTRDTVDDCTPAAKPSSSAVQSLCIASTLVNYDPLHNNNIHKKCI